MEGKKGKVVKCGWVLGATLLHISWQLAVMLDRDTGLVDGSATHKRASRRSVRACILHAVT
jgi:hypothetical protein